MSTALRRTVHAEAILGSELHAKLKDTRVLLVGAGGIGCELLKNIVLTGFGKITLLDLDTIDLSNLNRQFLFRKKDVKQSKALVAAQAAGPFNPNVSVTPLFANIKDPEYDVSWFKNFDIVLNALDNLDARRHVNKMCMAAQVPLVESGTAGYLGQIQPIVKDETECFDCVMKPTPKTFPVCTIRSTPSQPIHCIVWSKTYLMGQFFGEDEDAVGELDDAEQQGENAAEIATLRKEAQAFRVVRDALRSPSSSGEEAATMAFKKVFDSDIRNLLRMADMWKHRPPPTPLDYDAIIDGTFQLKLAQENGSANSAPANGSKHTNGHVAAKPSKGKASLKDQKALTLVENTKLFMDSTVRLAQRLRGGEETISFDKDDSDTLDFVTAASNLRSAAYGILGKSKWEIKEMAGNIIPAIATTNAIVSGLIVLQALQLLRRNFDRLRNTHIQAKNHMPLASTNIVRPNPYCGVCRDTYTQVQCDPAKTRLGEIVRGVLGDDDRDISVYEDKRLLSDPDWDDNNERTLESLNVTKGKFLSLVDDNEELETINVAIAALPLDHPVDGASMILPEESPRPPQKVKRPPPPPETPPTKQKRGLDDDLSETGRPPAKRARTGAAPLTSPSKKQRLEDDGLLLMEGVEDKMEEDIIELD